MKVNGDLIYEAYRRRFEKSGYSEFVKYMSDKEEIHYRTLLKIRKTWEISRSDTRVKINKVLPYESYTEEHPEVQNEMYQ